MGIPAYQNQGGQNSGNSASGAGTLPGSRSNGDLLIAYIQALGGGKTFAVGGGWTIPAGLTNSTASSSAALAWRYVDGSEAAPTFTWTGSAIWACNVFRFNGVQAVTPIGATNNASAVGSATMTVAGLVTTQDNSLIVAALFNSSAATIVVPTPANYKTLLNENTGSCTDLFLYGAVGQTGETSDSISIKGASANWNTFAFELLGSGVGSAVVERASQVTEQVLETYSLPAVTARASQVAEQVMETYSVPIMRARASQVVLQVLRTAGLIPPSKIFPPIYLTNCDTDVTYPGGPTWSSRTVRVDANKSNRPLGHWKRGLDVDQWILTLAPRSVDPIDGTPYPDQILGTPWIAAARAGALEGCEIEISRAFFPAWPHYAPTITPTGILSIFAGRIAEVDCTDSLVVITINDFRELLTTTIPTQVYSGGCRHTLFDFGCTLAQGNYIQSSSADTGSTKTQIIAATDLTATLASFGVGMTYALGNIMMTTGLNAGFSRTITNWSPPKTIGVLNPLPFAVSPGDTFNIFPGCNKSTQSCSVFGNLLNYGGEPFIPTPEAAL